MPAPPSPISHVRKLNNVTRTCQTPTKRPLKDVCPPRPPWTAFEPRAFVSCRFSRILRSRRTASVFVAALLQVGVQVSVESRKFLGWRCRETLTMQCLDV